MNNTLYLSYDEHHALLESMGITIHKVKRNESIQPLLRQLKQEQIVIVLVDEEIYRDHKASIDAYNQDPFFTITLLSDTLGRHKEAKDRLSSSIEQAIGTLQK
ncbi:hypothetical protein H9L01_07620 [Erysipelothrix inopinata]|uniref:V-type ATP synthase subunit F n=1 Tax=Erysipelothrix inopinata TaxID=225084 RepID=A0A7G9RXA8_9FIRM|nr:V-type ATP synthase subunit F [Erysipelothrix inopinata]QNN60233.1 hypothetical protein H9L01_07620 [Erysipelothrix inopinata]